MRRQLEIAIRNLAADPGLCAVQFFCDNDQAKLFCYLEAERLGQVLTP